MSSQSLICISMFLIVAVLGAAPALPANIKTYAFVNDDGTLTMRGKVIRLYGIHIPQTSRTCKTWLRPPQCGSRALHALEFKLSSGWPDCELRETNEDRSITALCHVKGTDLSAYLLERGWAVALPDAPIEYQALEKIARSRGIGVWGFAIGE
jgi:endonuclease YncB( thermonuclease family)